MPAGQAETAPVELEPRDHFLILDVAQDDNGSLARMQVHRAQDMGRYYPFDERLVPVIGMELRARGVELVKQVVDEPLGVPLLVVGVFVSGRIGDLSADPRPEPVQERDGHDLVRVDRQLEPVGPTEAGVHPVADVRAAETEIVERNVLEFFAVVVVFPRSSHCHEATHAVEGIGVPGVHYPTPV